MKIAKRTKNRCEKKNMWTCWVSLNNKIQHLAYLNVCLFICCAIRKKFAGHRRGEKKHRVEITELACLVRCITTLDSMFYLLMGNKSWYYLCAIGLYCIKDATEKKMWNVISRNRLVRFIWCGNTFLSTIRMLNRSKQTEISRARMCVWYDEFMVCDMYANVVMYEHQFYMSADR